MNYLSDLCFLCLVYDKNIKLKENDYLKIREEFQYFIPEHIFHNLEIPKYVCNDCTENLNKINSFRKKCLKNIAIYVEYEQKLSQYPGSHKYLSINLTNVLHQNNAEINCDVGIKTEIFEDENLKIQNDIKSSETFKIADNEDETNYDREVKSEICETDEINNGIEIHKVFIKVEDTIENNYIKHEINEEFIVKENDEKVFFGTSKQQEPFCNKNDSFNQHVSGNFGDNENDYNTTVSMCIQNQELLQNTEVLKCNKCPKTYSNKKDLEVHYRIHTEKSQICEKPFECDVCQKVFRQKENLRRHKFTHNDNKPYACDVCPKTYDRKCYLDAHKMVHTGEKPFVCDVCQKAFNRIHILRRHKLTHSVDKPFICEVCQKTFNRISHLEEHKFVHTGEKPHVCDVCQKKYHRLDVLRRHKLKHNGELPYKCDACEKTFSQVGHLKTHKLVHTGEKPYVCNVCQKAFNRLDSLRRHELTHNSDEAFSYDVFQKTIQLEAQKHLMT